MPKGRIFAPDGATDGIWFRHRDLPPSYSAPPSRSADTSTGLMLHAPYRPDSSYIPFPPPRAYLLRDSRNFKLANDFSEHNNRHLLQNTGEYFGDGQSTRFLGRRLAAPHLRHHTTPGNFLHDESHSWAPRNIDSIYTGSYARAPELFPLPHRRFPKTYLDPSPEYQPSTTTTHWYKEGDTPRIPALQVLASSQEPFLKTNHWKYSYHGQPKCYPPHRPASRKQTCVF